MAIPVTVKCVACGKTSVEYCGVREPNPVTCSSCKTLEEKEKRIKYLEKLSLLSNKERLALIEAELYDMRNAKPFAFDTLYG